MNKSKKRKTGLESWLADCATSLYAVDEQSRIVYCSPACLDLVGQPRGELIGRTCHYHSHPTEDDVQSIADALCPPPATMAGQPTTAVVVIQNETGESRKRMVRFLPLGPDVARFEGVLAVVEPTDLTEDDLSQLERSPEIRESDHLHRLLSEFRQARSAQFHWNQFVGKSPEVCKARRQAQLASQCHASVLIHGEPGTGRVHLAHTIHYAFAKDEHANLVHADCHILESDQLIATLTAAAEHDAHDLPGGMCTLLLQQIDEAPRESQAVLFQWFSRPRVGCRTISIARESLGKLVDRDEFHAGLAALLTSIQIELPPVRSRREDVPLLAQMLLETCNRDSARQISGFSPEALDLLAAYDWPGNLDEMASVVNEVHAAAENFEITADDLPQRITLSARAEFATRDEGPEVHLDDLLEQVTHELVHRALAKSKGNKAGAARLLGISRPRLLRLIEQANQKESP